MTNCPPRAAALGFFDGVHRGHAAILEETVRLARQLGLTAAAVSFSEHPRALTQGQAPPLLTTQKERRRLIGQSGIEDVFLLPFDRALCTMEPERFVREILLQRLGCRALVCGSNYRFGHCARGTPELLRDMGRLLGFSVRVVPPVMCLGQPVSSTRVRACVENGEMEQAAQLLGRSFSVSGTVVHGVRVGRTLGFPTVNLAPEPGLVLPRRGVYAALVRIDGERLRAVTNVGVRPTFGGGSVSIESHLLGFDREVYDRTAEVEFLRFLRPERAFASAQQLKEQIARDVQQALRVHSEVNL